MSKKEINWKYNIGDRIVDDKRDLTITEQIYLNNNKGDKVKYYKYKCNKCGFDCGEHFDKFKTFKIIKKTRIFHLAYIT